MLVVAALAAPLAQADACRSGPALLSTNSTTAVSYEARLHQPGYRFALGGVDWELQETTVSDQSGTYSFSIVYPRVVTENSDFAARDFFFSVDASENDAVDCSDMPVAGDALEDWLTDTTLYVTDDYHSHLRPGTFSEDLSRLQTMRTLGTTLRVRERGLEVVVATGFSATRMMDLGACLKAPGDSIGIVENQPGEIHITCYPEEASADYISSIDWMVDYQWPSDAPALIDDLIDYVHVEVLP